MPQISPMAANSSHPRLLTGACSPGQDNWYTGRVSYRQMPSGPTFTHALLLLAAGVGEAVALADAAGAAEAEAGVLEPSGAGAGALPPASVVPPWFWPLP